MPFRFADSEKPATIFPVAGQIQPRLSSSISGTRPDSVLGGDAGIVAGAGEPSAPASGAPADGAGCCCCDRANAWSAYGTLAAPGSVFNRGGLGRPLVHRAATAG